MSTDPAVGAGEAAPGLERAARGVRDGAQGRTRYAPSAPSARGGMQRRHRVEQRARVRMSWRRVHLFDGAALHHEAAVDDHDPVAHLRDDAEVVGHQQHRHVPLLAQPPQQREDLSLGRYVQRRRWLVGDQQLRIRRQRQRDHHALPHAAAQLVRVELQPRRRIGYLDLGQQVDGAIPRGLTRQVRVQAQRLDHLPPDAQRGVQGREGVLEDHPDIVRAHRAQLPLRQPEHVPALETERVCADVPATGHHPEN